MSFVSCDNSALVVPSAFPYGAVGSVITPTINLTPVASTTLLQPIAQLVVPKGVWMLTGTLFVDATVGGQTVAGNTGVALDATVFWRSQNVTVADGLSVSLSAVFSSNGANLLTIPMTYTTSGGATYGVSASPLSKVQLTRIA